MANLPDPADAIDSSHENQEQVSISSMAQKSRQHLESLLHQFGPNGSSGDLVRVEDSLGRFMVWARNLGAFRDPNSTSSLDYRLRNGNQMQTNVKAALQDIAESASRAKLILTGDLPNRSNEGEFQHVPSNVSQASLLSNTPRPPTSELRELLLGLEASINRLFRLSMLIRRHRPRGRLPGEAQLPEQDASIDIRHVKDKYAKVKESPWLAERLGRATAKRRWWILYRQSHHRRLADQNEGSTEGAETESRMAASTLATTYDESHGGLDDHLERLARVSLMTQATSFATAFGSDEDGELRVPDLTRLVFNGIRLDYNDIFECPFCRAMQLVSSEREWRRHVFTDLQPYVCTFESCSSPLFATRHEWFNHELESHRKQWQCHKCRNYGFKSAAGLREHLDTVHHGSVTEAQMPLILKACERPIRDFNSSSCPLCDDWAPPPGKSYNADTFCRHLGNHLQQLALTALPLVIDGLVLLDQSSVDEEETYPIEDLVDFDDGYSLGETAGGQEDESKNPDGPTEQTQPESSSSVIDRWEQIRKNAAERVARREKEERDRDESGEAAESEETITIEERVARIKARVAELTAQGDFTQRR
ncbi:hypothetical protein QBC33DRAFT_566309 [Phialemonium atrogriseum]|uniref:C2H2-type domain-containing protein n=1 Tax=Phialemonium atrogriseum TaxID=1093897 RepID=A0AAJ0C6F6_9PEZI|nr:uncharacterized protein QBC33DRAFT_566309 [Phialemonium atrogriseum]KAK1770845.1 hypothetical protein QBC33DRAFT_566309 [Phialemonium atrogriseum]